MAEDIRGDDGEVFCEDIDIAAEHVARGAYRMDQHKRRSLALMEVSGAVPVYIDELDLHVSMVRLLLTKKEAGQLHPPQLQNNSPRSLREECPFVTVDIGESGIVGGPFNIELD